MILRSFLLASLLAVASWSGIKLARCVKWTGGTKAKVTPTAFGLAIAPFLLGIAAVVSLAVLPGADRTVHSVASLLLLLGSGAFGARLAVELSPDEHHIDQRTLGWMQVVFALLVIAFAVTLVVLALVVPKNINDALEYLLVSRDLAITRDLWNTYPGLDSSISPSGFFFAWTHPPTFVALQYILSTPFETGSLGWPSSLVAPWVTLTNLPLVYMMGERMEREGGVVAMALFIATPLYFLGTVGGLIDPLPVLAVSLIAVVTTIGDVQHNRAPIVIGMTTGVALWSHSVSLLFLPIVGAYCVIVFWRSGASEIARKLFAVAVSAVAIGGAPYIRNLLRIGKLASDDPAVLKLPQLEWEAYYDFTRGIDTPMAKLQYGLLKSLFTPEAYGITFALAVLGLALLVRRMVRQRSSLEIAQAVRNQRATAHFVGVGYAAWPVAFVIGTAASLAIGTNILIRNERYFLVVLAPSAALAALGFLACTRWFFRQFARARVAKGLVISAIASTGVSALVVLVLFAARPLLMASDREDSAGMDRVTLGAHTHWPNLRAIQWIEDNIPPNSRVLSFRPGDFIYTKVRVMTHLDDKLVEVYGAEDELSAVTKLTALGIGWIHVSDYTPPTAFNSIVGRVLANPSYSSLVYSYAGHQVYRLASSELLLVGQSQRSRAEQVLTRFTIANLGGRKAILSPVIGRTRTGYDKMWSRMHFPLGLFQRHFSAYLATGSGRQLNDAGNRNNLYPVTGSEAVVYAEVAGRAFVRLSVVQFDSGGQLIGAHQSQAAEFLGDIVLPGDSLVRKMRHRFRLAPTTRYVKFLFLQHGNSVVRIGTIRVASYARPAAGR